ncbi:MAG: hypothetical protein KDD11_20800, partial [Acidobacteria bacterium]|nr:hypothetical protein [Acidobacteriota bacterium]
LGSNVPLGLITALIAVTGLAILYSAYRLVMLARSVNQFSSFLVDLAAAPGIILLTRSILDEPSNRDTSLALVSFYLLKLCVLVAIFWGQAGRRSDRGATATSVFRVPMSSPQASRYNNLWFSLISSVCAVGVSAANLVYSYDLALDLRTVLVLLIGWALFLASLGFNRIFLAGIGLRKRTPRGTVRALAIGRRFDSKLLRLTALFILCISLASLLSPLDSASFSDKINSDLEGMKDDWQARSEYVVALQQGTDLEQLGFETPELTLLFLSFVLTFLSLLALAHGELDRPPFFFLRGLVPFKTLVSTRDLQHHFTRLVFNTPFIGPFAKGLGALLTYILRSFDDQPRLSVGKLAILLGLIAFYLGAEDFIDRLLLVSGQALDPGFVGNIVRSYEASNDLMVWRACLSSGIVGFFLYSLGVTLQRLYLRSSVIVISLCFVGASIFRLRNLSLLFPVVCACAILGTFYLLHHRDDRGD